MLYVEHHYIFTCNIKKYTVITDAKLVLSVSWFCQPRSEL